tara:strand:+ start:247 stop:459 length:213 start_codon:yes stop_codon:yes gene_type:complete
MLIPVVPGGKIKKIVAVAMKVQCSACYVDRMDIIGKKGDATPRPNHEFFCNPRWPVAENVVVSAVDFFSL